LCLGLWILHHQNPVALRLLLALGFFGFGFGSSTAVGASMLRSARAMPMNFDNALAMISQSHK
jgi:hypothetical protein